MPWPSEATEVATSIAQHLRAADLPYPATLSQCVHICSQYMRDQGQSIVMAVADELFLITREQ